MSISYDSGVIPRNSVNARRLPHFPHPRSRSACLPVIVHHHHHYSHIHTRMSWYPPSRIPLLASFFCLSLAWTPPKRPDPSMRFWMPDARRTKRGRDLSLVCGLCGRNHIRTHGGGTTTTKKGGEAAHIGQPHDPSSFLSLLSLAILPCPCKRGNG